MNGPNPRKHDIANIRPLVGYFGLIQSKALQMDSRCTLWLPLGCNKTSEGSSRGAAMEGQAVEARSVITAERLKTGRRTKSLPKATSPPFSPAVSIISFLVNSPAGMDCLDPQIFLKNSLESVSPGV